MDGEILVSDRTDALLDRVQDRELMIELASPLSDIPGALHRFQPVLVSPDQLVFRYAHGSDVADQILGAIRDAGLRVREITTERPHLESMFLDMLRRR
jgi:ABC-2 type transport system ATP-binding protein